MTSRADVETWRGYVGRQMEEFYAFAGWAANAWDTERIEAARVRGRGPRDVGDESLFSGPWHTVRPYVSREFRQWVEEFDNTRHTLSEWVLVQRAERERQEGERSHLETAEHALSQLRELSRLLEWRDDLIRQAIERGASKVVTAEAANLSRQQVHTIVNAARPALQALEPVADSGGWVEGPDGEWVEAA